MKQAVDKTAPGRSVTHNHPCATGAVQTCSAAREPVELRDEDNAFGLASEGGLSPLHLRASGAAARNGVGTKGGVVDGMDGGPLGVQPRHLLDRI